jgi:GxxExxY protein
MKGDGSEASESASAFIGVHRSSLEKIDRITERVIGCAYTVSNSLGCGFLEKVYENAIVHELRKAGLAVQQQYPITVHYDEVVAGEFIADVLVEETVLVELKAFKELDDVHMAQCYNYLRATGLRSAC